LKELPIFKLKKLHFGLSTYLSRMKISEKNSKKIKGGSFYSQNIVGGFVIRNSIINSNLETTNLGEFTFFYHKNLVINTISEIIKVMS
jgi:hypothetical protein